MTEAEVVERLGRHVTVKSYHQTVHSGAHCFEFTATPEQMVRLLRSSRIANGSVQVILDEGGGVVYAGHIPNSRLEILLDYLDGDNLYYELLYSSPERVLDLLGRFCGKCGYGKQYCRCRGGDS